MAPKRRASSPSSLRNSVVPLDATDRRLLALLRENARLSIADLARQVGMSAPAVRERIGRLEQEGVIRGYRAEVDPSGLGLPVAAWVRVRPGPGQLPKIAALAEQLPQVSECHRVTGDDCFLIKVHAEGIEELEPVLDRFLLFGQTTTAIVVATVVAPRTPSLPDETE